jgi:hypothetical protein
LREKIRGKKRRKNVKEKEERPNTTEKLKSRVK